MRYFLRIKNLTKYQHYKDRNPPWIKLHREILQSLTWVTVSDASKTLAVASMLLAAGCDNKIPLDLDYIQRVAYLRTYPDFAPLIETDFLEIIDENDSVLPDASKMLANMKTLLAVARPEKEAEAEINLNPRKEQQVRDLDLVNNKKGNIRELLITNGETG